MSFTDFNKRLMENVEKILSEHKQLYVVDFTGDDLWNLYLDSFPAGTNEIFRKRREFDCQCCRRFIKNFANVVYLKDNKVCSIWQFNAGNPAFQVVIDTLDQFVRAGKIVTVFSTKESEFGSGITYDTTESANVITWEHFHLILPNEFVNRTNNSVDKVKGLAVEMQASMQKTFEAITEDALNTVLDLISSNSLERGLEWKDLLTKTQELIIAYNKTPLNERTNFCWDKSTSVSTVISKLRSTSMGTLLVNLSEGMELSQAVFAYESIIDPNKYKQPKPIFTEQMKANARKTIEELGYLPSLGRRFATIDDINIKEVLFADYQNTPTDTIFDAMSSLAPTIKPKQFDKLETITIQDFIANVLPRVQEMELYVENEHAPNFVSLITEKNPGSKTLFKWANPFSWAYTGNIALSNIKENVKNAGGRVDGYLRCSIQWNDGKELNPNDFDLHCMEGKQHIYFGDKISKTGGRLDVDIIHPVAGKVAVENTTWASPANLRDGIIYHFYVENFNNRGGKDGFSGEVELAGEVYQFVYDKPLAQKEKVDIMTVKYTKANGFDIISFIGKAANKKEVWGIKTQQFHRVKFVTYSPNYWMSNQVGHKHYFFMLDKCVNDEQPNGFFNEFIQENLLVHRQVFAALGSLMKVEDSPNQLSGLGFSSTKRASIVVKTTGAIKRTIRITF